jgi:L,D-peptidoglycan transpeptidase YkuD (ErfK/YbiS/YcfS/YnhG family)
MPLVEFELKIKRFERANTVHALDFAATVNGHGWDIEYTKIFSCFPWSNQGDCPNYNSPRQLPFTHFPTDSSV